MTVSALGTLAALVLLGWSLGGIALRLGGALALWAGLLGLMVTGDPNGLLVALLGALAWLAGHGHYALRHGEYKSPLAGAILPALGSCLACLTRRLARLAQGRREAAAAGERPGIEEPREGEGQG